MKIRYLTGDLLKGDQSVIVHSVNARGAFASGIAGQIRRELPFAYEAYRQAFEASETRMLPLGEVIWAFDLGGPRPRIVGNMVTQQNYGRDPDMVYVNYDAVTVAIQRVNDFARRSQTGMLQIADLPEITEVGLPLIGCGLGNGDWSIISDIIEQEALDFIPVVYLFDGKIPDRCMTQ